MGDNSYWNEETVTWQKQAEILKIKKRRFLNFI